MAIRRIVLREDTNERDIELLYQATGIPPEKWRHGINVLEQHRRGKRRPPREPAPAGSISIFRASKATGIKSPTIWRWVYERKAIPIIKRTHYETYINADIFFAISEAYKNLNGRKTLSKALKVLQPHKTTSN